MRDGGPGVFLLVGRIRLRPVAIPGPRDFVRAVPCHADGATDGDSDPAVHPDAHVRLDRHPAGDDRARFVRQRVRHLSDAAVLPHAADRPRGGGDSRRLHAVADLLADPVAADQTRCHGACVTHLGQRLERLPVAAGDDSAPEHRDPQPRPGVDAGPVRFPLAGVDGAVDPDSSAAGAHLRRRPAGVRARHRRHRIRRALAMASVSFERATRRYPGTPRPAVDALDLTVNDGEFLVLVGPSGCGKSTSLRMAAGLAPLNSGRLRIGERDVTDVDPKDRDIAMVFQNYALYPHMTVAQNLAFALKVGRTPRAAIRERVRDAAQLLDLEPSLDRKPKELSGGQRQRVAMGRAIVRRPQVFLMDEPLSNLDAKLRVQTRNQIAALQRRLGTTTVYVTHDQVEAMTMGDRVAVLNDGALQQCGPPRELYREPVNVFVAGFIGSPAMNLISLPIVDGSVSLGDWPIQVPREAADSASENKGGVRPEHSEVGGLGVEMQVDVVEELGADAYLYGRIADSAKVIDQYVVARTDGSNPPQKGSRVRLHPGPGHFHFFGVDGRRIAV